MESFDTESRTESESDGVPQTERRTLSTRIRSFIGRERRIQFFENRKQRLKPFYERVRNALTRRPTVDSRLKSTGEVQLEALSTANAALQTNAEESIRSGTEDVETERMMRVVWYAKLLMKKADDLMNWLAPSLTNYQAPEPQWKLPSWWLAVRQPIAKMFEVAAETGYGTLGWKKFSTAAAITGALNMLPGFAFYTVPVVYPIVLAMVMFKLRVRDLDDLVKFFVNPIVKTISWTLKGIGYAINFIADGTIGDPHKKARTASER